MCLEPVDKSDKCRLEVTLRAVITPASSAHGEDFTTDDDNTPLQLAFNPWDPNVSSECFLTWDRPVFTDKWPAK